MATKIVFNQIELNKLLHSQEGPVARHLLKTAIRVEAEAKRVCPVLTGRLRSSISHQLGRDAKGLFARIGSNVVYARRIELGFRGLDSLGRYYDQRPRPYLRSALAKVIATS